MVEDISKHKYYVGLLNRKSGNLILLAPNLLVGYTKDPKEAFSFTLDNFNSLDATGMLPRSLEDTANALGRCFASNLYNTKLRECVASSYRRENDFVPYIIEEKDLDWELKAHPAPRKSISKKTRLEVYNRFEGHCAYCGCELTPNTMQVDHIISHMYNGGEDNFENYFPSCRDCNLFKDASSIEDFRKRIVDAYNNIVVKRDKNWLSDRICKKFIRVENYAIKDIVFYFEKYREKHE